MSSFQHAKELAKSRLGDFESDMSDPNVYSHTLFEWDYGDGGGSGSPELGAFCPTYARFSDQVCFNFLSFPGF